MKLHLITVSSALLLAMSVSQPGFADKPEWAGGKEKPSREQVEAHREEMKAKRGSAEDEMEDARDMKARGKEGKEGKGDRDKMQKRDREHQDDDMHEREMKQDRDRDRDRMKESSMEKQREKKSESMQTQTEQGESKNRRWWKFWGE